MLFKRKATKNITPFQILLTFYFFAILISYLLLRLPGVHQDGIKVSHMDSLFTAVSAVSVTGLTTVTVSETYSSFGFAMILLILQFYRF